jgi:hypothetical protein
LGWSEGEGEGEGEVEGEVEGEREAQKVYYKPHPSDVVVQSGRRLRTAGV